MQETQTIGEVMHQFPHSIGKDQSLAVAKEMFHEHGIRHLPVCDGGSLCGVLTERDMDFTLRVEDAPAENILVKDCCVFDPYSVSADTPTHKVARYMAHKRIGCAIVTEKSRVVGIFTTVDACRVLAEVLSGIEEQ